MKLDVKTNQLTVHAFSIYYRYTGDASFLKVSGPSVWGLSDIESAKSTSEFIEPPQATKGFLYLSTEMG